MKDEEKKEMPVENNVSNPVNETVTPTGNKGMAGIKNFPGKSFGSIKGLHIIIAVAAVVALVVLITLCKGLFSSKFVDYPVIYNNSDGDLYLMSTKVKKEDKAVKLSSGDRTTYVQYANTNNRYVLFTKNEALYLYDARSKDETTKLVSEMDSGYYTFTDDDSYVIAKDRNGNLYSYNFKKDKEKLDSDITSIIDWSNDRVLYSKDGNLYIRSLKTKKDDKTKISEEFDVAEFSEDGKYIIYTKEEGALIRYQISNEKSTKVASDVAEHYCDSKSCAKLYYVVNDGSDKNLFYYNGKEGQKVTTEINYIKDINVDDQQVVYTKADGDKFTLYYQKGTKDAVVIEDDLSSVKNVGIFDGKAIYYVNGDNEVKYTKISGAKIGKVTKLVEDANSALYEFKEGYAVIADYSDDTNAGDLYLLRSGKAKKIDSDVEAGLIRVSNDGKKIYYMKDYKTTGDLYVTSGGKGKKIDGDVFTFNYIKDNLIYYIKDYSSSKSRGDLYRYVGNSKPKKIAEDVTRIASTPNYFEKK